MDDKIQYDTIIYNIIEDLNLTKRMKQHEAAIPLLSRHGDNICAEV